MNDHHNGITVIGAGRAAAAVDQVTVALGVEILRPDAGDAFTAAAASVSSLLAVLADNGVDARSVRTADLRLGPRMDYRDGTEILRGYAAGQRLIITLEALGHVESILSDVVARGGIGVRIDEVTLSAGNPADAYVTARDLAFGDAAAKALQYARLAGRTLGQVVRIDESTEQTVMPMGAARAFSAKSDTASMPVATGDTEVGVTVRVRWAFAD